MNFKSNNGKRRHGPGDWFCASFLVKTGKSRKQHWFWGWGPAPEGKRRVKEAMDRVALQAERRIANF